MDITAAIDVAIGLVLMYLVLSLLCTSINEFIAGAAKLRAKTMALALHQLIDNQALKRLFDDHGAINSNRVAAGGGRVKASPGTPPSVKTQGVAATAVSQPDLKTSPQPSERLKAGLLARLTTSEARLLPPAAAPAKADGDATQAPAPAPDTSSLPSYLSGRSVALALIASVDPANPIPAIGDVEDAVKALPDSNIRDVLLAALTEADGKMEKLRDSVATWFDGAMDRLSGAYKRDLQIISLVVGFVVAAAFNADSLSVGTKLWQDRSLGQMIAASAPDFVKAHCPDGACKLTKGAAPAADQPLPIDDGLANISAAQNTLRGFPIGWTGQAWPTHGALWFWFFKIAGLWLTAAALMLGAPFWFDLLQKIMNLRGAGEKPAKATAPVPTT